MQQNKTKQKNQDPSEDSSKCLVYLFTGAKGTDPIHHTTEKSPGWDNHGGYQIGSQFFGTPRLNVGRIKWLASNKQNIV